MSDYFTYNKTSNLLNQPNRNQSVTIYDLLSEGPIQGLLKDGIFLDGRAVTLQGSDHETNLPTISTDVDYVASTNILTDNNSKLVSVVDPEASANGIVQYLILRQGKKIYTTSDGTITLTNTSGVPTIETGTAFFNSTDKRHTYLPPQFIQINYTNGSFDRRTLETQLSTTKVTYGGEVLSLDGRTIASISIDKIGLVNSTSGQTITIADISLFGSEDRDITEGIAEVATRQHSLEFGLFDSETTTSPHIVDNFKYSFRNGFRDQTHFSSGSDIGSSSLVVSPGTQIKQTNLSSQSITGYAVNNATTGGYTKTNSEGQIVTPDAAGTSVVVTAVGGSTTLNAGNQIQDIDLVRVTFQIEQLLASKPKTSTEGPTYIELRIFFRYKPTGSSSFEEVLVFGPSNATLEARGNRMTSNFKGLKGGRSSGHIEAESKSPFIETFTINVGQYQPFDNFEIKVEKVNPDNGVHKGGADTFTNHLNSISLKTVEAIIMDKLAYPYSAYAQTSFDASGFSNIPERQYKIRGIKVQVPTNYFPRHELGEGTQASYTRNVSTGATESTYQNWDGKFRGDRDATTGEDNPSNKNFDLVWTDNPVWIFYDLLTNKRYGLGEYISASDIDKYELFKIAKFCDEPVPDGKGGTEPRFSCNVWLLEQAEAFKIIKDFAGIFRGVIHYIDGQVTLSTNSEKQPVYTFSKSNVIDGLFNYQSTRKRTRHNSIVVSWNDPEQMYKKNVEIVEDTNDIVSTGQINQKTVTAFGCTSRAQAHRYGKFHLLSELLESEVVSFATGINAQHLKPGDVIEVQNADLDNLRYSGRVKSGSTTTVVNIDDAVSLNTAGSTYYLSVVFPTGVAYLAQDTATISSVTYKRGDIVAGVTSKNASANIKDDSNNKVLLQWSGNTHTQTKLISSFTSSSITVNSAFSSAPSANAIWGVTEFSTSAEEKAGSLKEYIISDIAENTEDQIFTISAAEYDRSKFQLVDRGYDLYEVPETNRPPKYTEVVPAPQNLAVSQVSAGDVDEEAGRIGSNLLVSWQHPESNRTGVTNRYEYIQHYEIEHNINTGNVTTIQEVDGRHTSFTIRDVPSGTYKIGVRLINTLDRPSKTVFKTITVTTDKFPISVGSRIGALPVGGSLDSKFTINSSSGLVTIANSTYTHVNPNGLEFSVSSGNSSQTTQAFSGLSSGETGFLAIDASDTSDPLKALEEVLDFTAVGLNSEKLKFEYLAEVGASNSGISSASGTVTAAQFATTLTGSSTAFTTDYAVGDRIIIDSGSTRFFATVTNITSNTSLDINQALIRAYSGVNIFKLSFKPDFLRDTIIGRVTNNSGTYVLTDLTSQGVPGTDGDDGSPGSAGLRQVQGYLYYEKTTNTGVAPSTPGSTTYTFSTGDIDGGSGATEVLALADTSATDKWTNSPRTQDVGSTSSFWTVRYSGGESSAGASTCTVSYSTIVAQTAFTGVVTFSGGTTFQEDGSDIFNITQIDGGNITTGQIDSANLASTRGTRIDLTNDKIIIGGTQNASSLVDGIILDASTAGQPKFFVGDTSSFIRFNNTADKLEINTSNFSIASNGDVTLSGAVTSTSGTIGGFTLGSTSLTAGSGSSKVSLDTSNGIHLGNDSFGSAPFRVTPAGALTADSATLTNATVSGTVTASAINLDTATITGTLDADKLQIDDVTIDTDGSGNLIIKSAGVSATQLGTRAAGAFKVFTTGASTIGVDSDPNGSATYVEIISFGTDGGGAYTNQGSFEPSETGSGNEYSVFYSGTLQDPTEDFSGDDSIDLLLQVFENNGVGNLVSKSFRLFGERGLGFSISDTFTPNAGKTYQIRVFARENNGLTTGATVDNNYLCVFRITKGQ